MTFKSLLLALTVALSTSLTAAHAAPVVATYTATGSAGNWTYDLTIENKSGNQYLYHVAASVDNLSGVLAPAGFSTIYGPGTYFGTVYNARWGITSSYSDAIKWSESKSGFTFTSTSQTVQSSIDLFAYGYNFGAQYAGTDYLGGTNWNPAFLSTATLRSPAQVPEPTSIVLLAAGLLGAGLGAKRKKPRAVAA